MRSNWKDISDNIIIFHAIEWCYIATKKHRQYFSKFVSITLHN